jgi:hypothetical protein
MLALVAPIAATTKYVSPATNGAPPTLVKV